MPYIDTQPLPLAEADGQPLAFAPIQTLTELGAAIDRLRHAPVITLRQALEQLGLMDPAQLNALQDEDPLLLRSRSAELVDRVLVTDDGLQQALAHTAGLPEVDVVRFAVPPEAFQDLPVREALQHGVVPLGLARDQFYVASWAPTNDELQRQLCLLTGHRVTQVWAAREAILQRLGLQENAGPRTARAPLKPLQMELPGSAESRAPGAGGAPAVELLVSQALVELSAHPEQEQASAEAATSGMVRLVQQMIGDALAQCFVERSMSLTQTLAQMLQTGSTRELQIEQPIRLIGAIQNVALVVMPAFIGSIASIAALGASKTTISPTEAGELAYRLRDIISQFKP